jgi:hypothetical protein
MAPPPDIMARMKTDTGLNDHSALWARAIEFEAPLSSVAARALLKVRLSQRHVDKINALAAKARAGTLTPTEQVDLDAYERLGSFLDIVHSKARRALKARRRAS